MKQITNHILMVKPKKFGYNPQTAEDNYYQKQMNGVSEEEISQLAKKEFDEFVEFLSNFYAQSLKNLKSDFV